MFFHQGHQTQPDHNDDCKNFTDSVSVLVQIKTLPKRSKNLTDNRTDFHGQISPQVKN